MPNITKGEIVEEIKKQKIKTKKKLNKELKAEIGANYGRRLERLDLAEELISHIRYWDNS